MLNYIVISVALLAGAGAALIASDAVSPSGAAAAVSQQRVQAAGPEALALASSTLACLDEGGSCTVGSAADKAAAAKQVGKSAWRGAPTFLGAYAGCASDLSANASTTWRSFGPAACPPLAVTTFLAIVKEPGAPSSAPFSDPPNWWLGAQAMSTDAADSRFAGVVSLALPGLGTQQAYIWARTVAP